MSLWVIDTDTATLLLHGQPNVCQSVAAHKPNELRLTIITVEELLTGWYTQVRRAKDDARLVRAYTALQQTVEFVGRLEILPFDATAIQVFRQLRPQHRRLSTNDLRIGAIALRFGAVLVTRNQNDFVGLTGLSLEDWS